MFESKKNSTLNESNRTNNQSAFNKNSLNEADYEEIEKMLIKPINLTPEQMLD